MGTAIALGNFDGVHLAHAALIRSAKEFAAAKDDQSLAYVFEPHPKKLFHPEADIKLLMTPEMKARRLREAGADCVFLEKRGMEILSLSPETFFENVLMKELNASFITAGFNYRFGKNASGDAALLKKLCAEEGIACRILDPMTAEGEPISSTRLRALLEHGEISAYNIMSFAPYTVSGTVQKGKQLGRTIGFPTLNVEIPTSLLLPKKGVYISRTYLDGIWYESITNIGVNPTVETAMPRAESYLPEFAGDAYGKCAETALLQFIRPEQKFGTLAALKEQIAKDTEITKRYFKEWDFDNDVKRI